MSNTDAETITITDPDTWAARSHDITWQQTLRQWLVGNGIDHAGTDLAAGIAIVTVPGAGRRIRYATILTGPDGRPHLAEDGEPAASEPRTTALLNEPPQLLLPGVDDPAPVPAGDEATHADPEPDTTPDTTPDSAPAVEAVEL